jgi:asparagine synthase (glutamine-hydrolysing)
MCGIVGGIGRVVEGWDSSSITGLCDRLRHRGPDDAGTWLSADNTVAFGHRRLAVVDLSPAGHQPMTSADGDWTITYNGEIYNHHDLRRRLPGSIRWRGTSDTEVLVECFAAWGVRQTLDQLNGMFAIAAWQHSTRTLWLVRDRLGEKPLYWWHDGPSLGFASEMQALPSGNEPWRINEAAAADVLRWGYVTGERTIYEAIQQLPPGGLVRCRLADKAVAVAEERWYDTSQAIQRALRERRSDRSMDDSVAEFSALFQDSVSLRLGSDAPLGAFLSGGVDSALVAAFAQEALGERRLQTFTVRIPEHGLDESEGAARTAATIGSDHQVVDLPIRDMLDVVPRLAATYDQPFGDPSMLPTLLLSRAARRHLTVCLAGDGGDELFGGYNRHSLGASLQRWSAWTPRPLRRTVANTALRISPSGWDRLSRLTAVAPQPWRVPRLGDKMHKAARTLAADDPWASLAGLWPASCVGRGAYRPASGSTLGVLDRMLSLDTTLVLPNQMLTKVDRASMRASLEVRLPFLDHRLLEWAWTLPPSHKVRGGVGKVVLRQLLQTMVPDAARRPKLGFDPPIDTWLRGPLRPWAESLLASPACTGAGWLDANELAATWQQHLRGERNWGYRLWPVLMLEDWLAAAGQRPL